MLRKAFLSTLLSCLPFISSAQSATLKKTPLRVGVVGLTHTHVHWILGRPDYGDIEIVGIAESNRDLARRYSEQHGFSMEIVFDDLGEMLDETKPSAVFAFNPIFEHLETVQVCAPRGVHVMVEKPLAVNLDHAQKMQALAEKHKIQLLTNYETTWYASNHKSYAMVHDEGAIGEIRKIVVHDGHQGPKEIGVNEEFLDWLTDPVQNGGGAVTDFGCYGANLVTWLMRGQRPLSVFAVTQTIKPEIYPKVDDEATIVITYPEAQGIIQASWNWPFSRKDMHVYGQTGYVFADDGSTIRYRLEGQDREEKTTLEGRDAPFHDPFAYFAAVLAGEIEPKLYDLSSLENNIIVMEILDAAIQSARTGKAIKLNHK